MKKIFALALAISVTQISGCFDKDAPEPISYEVNENNCRPEFIKKITPKNAQEKLAGECAHRNPFVKSQDKEWKAFN